ncbi:MAG: Cytochrome-c peroxidase [Bacteroidetes bacterium]|nr:Cytochrome-c peroxidase [Bacteroidota bacterium]
MTIKKVVTISTLLCFVFLLSNFTEDNPYFKIGERDVTFQLPKGFPVPNYTFKNNKPTPAGFTLGRMLFYDPILSKDSTTSCASCHQRIAAFAHIDHPLSHGINGLIGKRNVPALQNLAWGQSFMWDGGVNNLEVQPLSPMTNPIEMNSDLGEVLKKLKHSDYYRTAFKEAYGDTLISSERMLKAITQFTGMMVSSNSRYDKFMRHEDTLSQFEFNGLIVFREKCAKCHREPLFTDESFKSSGLMPDTLLNDPGRELITGRYKDENTYKVPSLRNVAMTYPYMHDGRFRSLEQVLDHYAAGKFYTLNISPELLEARNLSDVEKKEIIAFLKTLTDKEFLYDRRFADPTYR